jgi:tetratricopeptide (TPR) repeat protein
MKKLLVTITLAAFISSASAQNNQVLNSINYLKSKELDKAKAATDAASAHDKTKGEPKTWTYRGAIYQAIYQDRDAKVYALDNEAEEKSLEAFITALKLDKDNIYKDQIKGPIVDAAAAVRRKADFYGASKDFEKALKCYEMVESALVYDFDQGMKRNNITKEKLLFNRFEMYRNADNRDKAKEMADKLIEIKWKEPKIYYYMIQTSLDKKDTATALSYIEKGKLLFEENMLLIGMEIDLYIAQNKTNVLKDKLAKAIEVSPDNEILHLVLAQVNEKTGNFDVAEKSYLKALELKPDNENANYNLGAMYFNLGNDWNKKLNALPAKDPKAKEYETKSNDYFKKAIVYLEKSFSGAPPAATKQRLRQLYYRLGDTANAEKYK